MLLTPEQVGAVNVILSGVQLAQKRGAFTLDESAKLWDCVKHFQ